MKGDLVEEPQKYWARLPLALLPPALFASLFGWAILVSTLVHPGWIGLNHIGPGTDWMVFYGAIRAMLDGNLPLVMNGDQFHARHALQHFHVQVTGRADAKAQAARAVAVAAPARNPRHALR